MAEEWEWAGRVRATGGEGTQQSSTSLMQHTRQTAPLQALHAMPPRQCRLRTCSQLLRSSPPAPLPPGVLLLPVFVNSVVQSTLQVLLFACYAGFLVVLLVLFRCAAGAAAAGMWGPLLDTAPSWCLSRPRSEGLTLGGRS